MPPSAEWPRLRLRVDLSPGCSIGPGKISLLQAIDAVGSLSLAAQRIGMSYRRAWNLLDDLNGAFAKPLVTTAVGGAQGGGARLTAQGARLIRAYEKLERGVKPLARRTFAGFTARRSSRKAPARRKLSRPLAARAVRSSR